MILWEEGRWEGEGGGICIPSSRGKSALNGSYRVCAVLDYRIGVHISYKVSR